MPSEQIDPMLFEKSYYLEPEKTGAKPYALLREALEAADRMALVTVSLRNRMSLAVLRVRDDVIVMQTMMWPDEIRKPDFGSVDTSEAKPAEVKMATMLVDTLAGDFDADEFEDDYREAVEALVKAKIEGGEVKRTPEAKKSSGEVVDLLAALQRSVDAAKTARGEKVDSDESEKAAKSGKTAGKKSSASKSKTDKENDREEEHERRLRTRKPVDVGSLTRPLRRYWTEFRGRLGKRTPACAYSGTCPEERLLFSASGGILVIVVRRYRRCSVVVVVVERHLRRSTGPFRPGGHGRAHRPADRAHRQRRPGRTSRRTSSTARSYSIVQVGDKVVVGGTFTQVRTATSSTDPDPQPGLRVQRDHRRDQHSFNPGPNGTVYKVQAAADGTRSTSAATSAGAGGSSRSRLFKVERRRPAAAVTASRPPSINGEIRDLEVVGNRLWVAGKFTHIGGVAQRALGTLNATTGAYDTYFTGVIAGHAPRPRRLPRRTRTNVLQISSNPQQHRARRRSATSPASTGRPAPRSRSSTSAGPAYACRPGTPTCSPRRARATSRPT